MTAKGVAKRLGISWQTANKHLKGLYSKRKLRKKPEAIEHIGVISGENKTKTNHKIICINFIILPLHKMCQ